MENCYQKIFLLTQRYLFVNLLMMVLDTLKIMLVGVVVPIHLVPVVVPLYIIIILPGYFSGGGSGVFKSGAMSYKVPCTLLWSTRHDGGWREYFLPPPPPPPFEHSLNVTSVF